MNQLVLFVIIIIVALILIGIYTGENIQANNLRNKLIEERKLVENFGPLIANDSDINSGSSTLYKWGIENNKKTYAKRVNPKKPKVKPGCVPACPPRCKKSVECENRPSSSENNHYKICRNCDITLNKDIDKYVLKSSVPPPVDMEDFARKNMVCPQINMDDYILKSEVPACPKVDMSQYILKSDIPACPDIPQCPKCPKCPVQERCKKIFEYKITEHPEFNKFISKSDCENAVRTAIETDNSSSSRSSGGGSSGGGSSGSQNTMGEQSETTGNYGMYASFTSCSPYSS